MVHKKNRKGWIIIWVLCLIPIVLWFLAPSGIPRFGDLSTVLVSLGKLFALVGTAMFALTLFLSARIKIFEKYFDGLNMVYERHNQLGQLALILLMFHPLLLLPKYTTNFSDAAGFLLPNTNWAQNWGIFSLGLMIVLIVLTLYLKPKYNIWKWTHKFLGLAFFFAMLHIWLIPSDTYSYLPLRIYILLLATIGLLAFFYRTLFGKFLVHKYKFEITSIRNFNDNVVEISLKPSGSSFTFNPGQFVFIQFVDSEIGAESHPFSIVSAPEEPELKLTIKNLGDYTSKLAMLSVGGKALIEGPFGVFSYKQSINKSQIWIAGGIGITPFVSMVKSILSENDYSVDLFYCVKNDTEAVYLDELQQIAADSSNRIRLHLFCSEIKGRINMDIIETQLGGDLSKFDIFICTPVLMISSIKNQLEKKGILDSCIHSEEFNF